MSDNILELKALVLLLLDKIAALELTISKLEADNAALKAENSDLRAGLHLNSHNSNKPRSSGGLHKKPAFPKEKNLKRGGQKGHDGHTLGMVKNPDHIVICKTDTCTCGQDLFQQSVSILARRHLFDLPEPRLEVTEYQIAQVFCPICGQSSHRGEFPSNINAPLQYGTGVKALVTSLNSEYKLPFEKIQTLSGVLFGYAINVGIISTANAACLDKLAATEALIQEEIIGSKVVNSEESGVRYNGKLHWLHVASHSRMVPIAIGMASSIWQLKKF